MVGVEAEVEEDDNALDRSELRSLFKANFGWLGFGSNGTTVGIGTSLSWFCTCCCPDAARVWTSSNDVINTKANAASDLLTN